MKTEDYYIKMAQQIAITKYNNMNIICNSIFGIDSIEPIPMEISGYIVDWNLDKDGNKLIDSFDLRSVNYTYHNPFKDKENLNINEIS